VALDPAVVTFDNTDHDDTLTGSTITGTTALTKGGDGTLMLTGTNSYEGGATIVGGLIVFSRADNFGSDNNHPDVGAQGYAGKHEGVTGSLKVNYRF
jgi:autotransporter-associated beta strand protein